LRATDAGVLALATEEARKMLAEISTRHRL
jgi:hypothetical protein